MFIIKVRKLLLCLLLLAPFSLPAYDASPKCFKQLQTEFFNESTVLLALSFYKTYQSQWDLIGKALQREGQAIPRIMKQRARKMRPSPLYPFQKEAALKLFREVTWEIFIKVMKKYDGKLVRYWSGIYNFIYETELRRLDPCLNDS